MRKVRQEGEEKCRKVREQAELYIKSVLGQHNDEDKPE